MKGTRLGCACIGPRAFARQHAGCAAKGGQRRKLVCMQPACVPEEGAGFMRSVALLSARGCTECTVPLHTLGLG